MSRLEVENLAKIFGPDPKSAFPLLEQGADRKTILERTGQTVGVANVSFSASSGEIVVIMGLSGSGKSTLVRMINRLIEPTSGTITFDGENVTAMPRRRLREFRRKRAGMVFQHFALFPHRTVLQNAAFGLEVLGQSSSTRSSKALEVLELVGLKGWEYSYPGELSGGMQQRVGLARALAVEPDIILMDEALSALDPLIRTQMQQELLDLQKNLNKIILFISHDLHEAIALGDRIILLKDGFVVQEGVAEDLVLHPASEYVAQFIEDIDQTEVLTAAVAMTKPGATVRPAESATNALRILDDHDASTAFIISEDGKVFGLLEATSLRKTVPSNADARAESVAVGAKTIPSSAPIQKVLELMIENQLPVAVVDDSGCLVGEITANRLLATIAKGNRLNGDR